MPHLKLGTLISEVNDRTTINNQYEVLTSSQDGIVSQSEYFNKQVASVNNIGYKIIKKGQFTYRSMSDTGKFYINKLNNVNVGIVSPAYPVFEISSSKIITSYLELFFQSSFFQNQISNKSAGSTRLALKYNRLSNLDINVPNIGTQEEIVNTLSLIKKQIKIKSTELNNFDELVKSRFMCQEASA